MKFRNYMTIILLTQSLIFCSEQQGQNKDPLPSWNEGITKQSIINCVDEVTNEANSDFLIPEDRIAAFDNDGTLWSEQPYYFQFQFAIDRVSATSADHPEWENNPLF